MERDDALDAFLAVINIVRPDHPYYNSPYPLDTNDVKFGTTRKVLASCGPRGRRSLYKVCYKTRMNLIRKLSRAGHLALLTHEVTHVTIGGHSSKQHGSHPPSFWRELAFNALLIRDSLQDGGLKQVFPELDVKQFLKAVVLDPNYSTVDRRYWSVEECRNEVAALLDIEMPDIDRDDIYYRTFDSENADSYDSLPYKDKAVLYRTLGEKNWRPVDLIEMPGIGKRTVEQIGSEFEVVDEMVDGTQLNSRIADVVSSQYHDDLWASIRSYTDYKHQSEDAAHQSGTITFLPPRPPRSLYFDEKGDRRLPTEEELKDAMTRDESELGIFTEPA